MAVHRSVPMRKCTGCNEMKPKKELVRVVRSPEGEISVDLVGKKPGRGAYVCPDRQCIEKARKAKRLEKAFSCEISDEIYRKIEEELENGQE